MVASTHGWRRRAEFRVLARRAVRNADGVLTDSHASRHDLERLVPDPDGRPPRVVHLGVSDAFLRHDGRRPTPVPRVDGPYILFVGSLEPRKNIVTAVRAYDAYRGAGGRWPLVLTGPPGWKNADVYQEIRARGLEEKVMLTGYLDDAALPALYANAGCLLYPSIYEGFGLPVLEAMAVGCPVVASNVSSVPEVAGDACVLVDPMDHAAIAGWLGRIEAEPGLRDDMARRGRARAAGFTWSECARKTQEFYDEVAG